MTGGVRSRRASVSLDRPLYARMLRLRHLAPSGLLCFVYLEGAFALGILLALAELVSWWGVLVLPAVVALMVKLNDVVAGLLVRPAARAARGGRRGRTGRDTGVRPDAQTPRARRNAQVAPTVTVAAAADEEGLGRGARVGPGDRVGGRRAGTPGSAAGQDQESALRPAVGRATPGAPASVPPEVMEAGPPTSRAWGDQLDVREQMSRQSAARRYE